METRVVALTSAQLAQLHPTVVAAAVATQSGEAIPVALAPAEVETDQADVSMDEPTVPVDLAEEPTSSGSAVAEADMEQGKKTMSNLINNEKNFTQKKVKLRFIFGVSILID